MPSFLMLLVVKKQDNAEKGNLLQSYSVSITGRICIIFAI